VPVDNAHEFVFDERYAEAFFHVRSHRVLGIDLKPFSAWHRTVLEYINSPTMTGELMTPPDLRMAATVCSLQFPDVPSPRKTGFWSKIKAEHQMIKDHRVFEAQLKAFWSYISDYVSMPVLMMNGQNGESDQVPDIDQTLMDVALYRHNTSCPREEPWNIPIGELVWMNAAMARTQGTDLHVVSTIEEERLKQLKEKLKNGL